MLWMLRGWLERAAARSHRNVDDIEEELLRIALEEASHVPFVRSAQFELVRGPDDDDALYRVAPTDDTLDGPDRAGPTIRRTLGVDAWEPDETLLIHVPVVGMSSGTVDAPLQELTGWPHSTAAIQRRWGELLGALLDDGPPAPPALGSLFAHPPVELFRAVADDAGTRHRIVAVHRRHAARCHRFRARALVHRCR